MMKQTAMICLTAVLAGVLTPVCSAAPLPPKNLKTVEIRSPNELSVRNGLPNFCRKLRSGEPVRIAYFGGSITAQDGWRPQSLEYFRSLSPTGKVEQIHAAIGGTGSELGAFRLEQDVLRHKPDLVFVEFAVNDGGTSPYRIRQSMEGIVRHIWKTLPETDICFVYTLTASHIPDLLKGKTKRSTSTMEEIADYYKIPSVSFEPEIARLVKEGKLVMKSGNQGLVRVSGEALNLKSDIPVGPDGKVPFSRDGVHPYPNTGHVIYTNILKRSFEKIAKVGKPAPHTPLPAPMVKDNFENACMVSPDHPGIRFSGPVEKLPLDKAPANLFRNRAPGCVKLSPGGEFEFKFKGSKVSLYILLGPGCGVLEVSVDGKKPFQRRLVDPYCTYYRLSSSSIADYLNPDAVHTVKIRLLNETPDKRSILFERNRADYDKNPEKYKPIDAYLGAILLVGEIVKE